jgi:hypothetical protein
MSENKELIFLFMPSLVATLANKEKEKGAPLTEAEVLQIRDACPVVMSPPLAAQKVTEARGYDDIDPENVWSEWQRVRVTL